MRKHLTGALLAIALAIPALAADDAKKIRVVIIDGQNNHNWRATTPLLKKVLRRGPVNHCYLVFLQP